MRFTVGNTVTDDSNNGDVPATLNNVNYPPPKTEVDHVFNFQHGGDDLWTINGVDFNDINNRILARPQQGTVELWELNYAAGPGIHPAHIHLVNFQIVSRTGGRPVLPYESAGLKDTVLLAPGESVQALATYGPWNGLYMFHCHNLIHEDNMMLDAFNVTALDALGYKFGDTQLFADPLDPRFAPRPSKASDYEESAIRATVSALGKLGAYKYGPAVASAEAAYYSTAGYPTTEGESQAPATGSETATATKSPTPASGSPTATSETPASVSPTGHQTVASASLSSAPGYTGSSVFASPSAEPSGGPSAKGKRWLA